MPLCSFVSRNLPRKSPLWRPSNRQKGAAWAGHTYLTPRRSPEVDATHRGHKNVEAIKLVQSHTSVHGASMSDSVWLIMWPFPGIERGVTQARWTATLHPTYQSAEDLARRATWYPFV